MRHTRGSADHAVVAPEENDPHVIFMIVVVVVVTRIIIIITVVVSITITDGTRLGRTDVSASMCAYDF